MSGGTSSHQINQGPLEDTGLTFNCPFHPQLALVLSLSSARATSKRIDTQSLPRSLGYHKEQSAPCLKRNGEWLLRFIYSTWPANNDYYRLDHIFKHWSFQVIRTQASQKNIVLRFHVFILPSTQSTSYLLTHRPSITGHSFQSHKDLSTSCLPAKGQYFLLHPSRLDC